MNQLKLLTKVREKVKYAEILFACQKQRQNREQLKIRQNGLFLSKRKDFVFDTNA